MKRLILALLMVCMIVTPALAKSAKSNGAVQYEVGRACDVFPGTVYDNPYQLPEGAGGKVIVNQPNGAVSVNITLDCWGLAPNTVYKVIWGNAVEWGNFTGGYGWDPRWDAVTDEYGHLVWQKQIWAEGGEFDDGAHYHSLWVNRSNPNATVLISKTFTFTIEP